MALGPLKPDPTDIVGLIAAKSPIGSSAINNCRVWVKDIQYVDSINIIEFSTIYFWNAGAFNAWQANHDDQLNQPFHRKVYRIGGLDDVKSLRRVCYEYLVTLDPFNGVDATGSVPWVF